MVIDDRRKVIFIHIPKCGGISVERTIHKALGGNDKIPYPQLIRRNPKEGRGALGLHSTLKDYRRYYSSDINDFYIFSFVRNPWRRMTSHYEFLVKQMYNKRVNKKDVLSFPEFVQVFQTRLLAFSIHSYDEYLRDDYNTKVNFVGKLENIEEDLRKVGDDIKLEITEVLHMNQTDPKLKEHKNWKDYYNPGLKDRVYNIFKSDIEKYNYEFDE
jgi:hypothetical protein